MGQRFLIANRTYYYAANKIEEARKKLVDARTAFSRGRQDDEQANYHFSLSLSTTSLSLSLNANLNPTPPALSKRSLNPTPSRTL